ncbi:MAG TPA: TolC family protein [Williamwhitmania sp.]|nr:TolC family protein [Williamwhitmania sp.]
MRSKFNTIKLAAMLIFLPVVVSAQDTLSLGTAVKQTLENNFSIRMARNDASIAKNNNSLGNAGFLPTVNANASTSNSRSNLSQSYSGGTSYANSAYPTHNQAAGVQLSWALFDGFAMFATREQYATMEQMGDLSLQMAVEDAVSSTILGYYTIVQEEKLKDNYREVLNLSRTRLNIAREKAEIGAGYQLAAMQADVDFRADSAQLLQQSNNVQNLKVNLNKLMGRDPETEFEVAPAMPESQQMELSQIFDKLLAQNKELLLAKMNLCTKELSLRQAQAKRYPTISLSSAYSYSRISTPDGSTEVNRSFGPSFGLGASITLFNGMNANRAIKNARLQRDNQDLSNQATTLNLKGEAVSFFNDLRLAIALVDLGKKSVEMAKINAEVALEKYKIGVFSDLELRDAQNRYLDAEYRYLNAQLQAKTAEVELQVLMGAVVMP